VKNIRALLTVPKSGLVDVVAWVMTVLGTFGIAIAGLQLLMLTLIRVPSNFWGLWLVAAIQFAIIALVGFGLRRRRSFARVALIWMLVLGVLWNTYGLVGAIIGRTLPLLPGAMLEFGPFRFAVVGISIFWSAVYIWLVLKFTNPDVVHEFVKHDV
jgi:hypothetical protein